MTSEANKHQVGGRHYKVAYEHWDWVVDNGLGYLVGCATKYVSRWRKKGGVQDLQKGLHYINKLIEVCDAHPEQEFDGATLTPEQVDSLVRFSKANELSPDEEDVCLLLCMMRSRDDLLLARDIVTKLMEQVDQAQPVPLDDSNKHAPRSDSDRAFKG